MSSFFDNDEEEEEDYLPRRQPIAGPSRARPNLKESTRRDRGESIISSSSLANTESRSFLSRLESTLSPGPSDRFSLGDLPDLDQDGVGPYAGVVGGGEMLEGPFAGMEIDMDGKDEEDLDDVRRLSRVWVKERGTIDVMPWEGDLIDTLFDKLIQQQKMVDTLRADPKTSEEEHFKLILVQTEMERVKFVIRSYVRTRLHKIEKYAHHIVLSPQLHQLLSGAELSHAQRYTELLHTHFQHSILDSLPDWLQKMDDSYGDGLSMVSKPNKHVPVLIHCRRDCGEITLDSGERAELGKGSTHLVKYTLVERWISLGWAEVL